MNGTVTMDRISSFVYANSKEEIETYMEKIQQVNDEQSYGLNYRYTISNADPKDVKVGTLVDGSIEYEYPLLESTNNG